MHPKIPIQMCLSATSSVSTPGVVSLYRDLATIKTLGQIIQWVYVGTRRMSTHCVLTQSKTRLTPVMSGWQLVTHDTDTLLHTIHAIYNANCAVSTTFRLQKFRIRSHDIFRYGTRVYSPLHRRSSIEVRLVPWLLFGRCWIRISVDTLSIPTEVFRGFLPGFTSIRAKESKTSFESYDLWGYDAIRLSISLPAFRRRMMHSSSRWMIKPKVEKNGRGMEKRENEALREIPPTPIGHSVLKNFFFQEV